MPRPPASDSSRTPAARRTRRAAAETTDGAADAKPDEEDRENDREGVDRAAEQQAELARPNHFGRQRAEAGQADDHVDQEVGGRGRGAARGRRPRHPSSADGVTAASGTRPRRPRR